MSIIVYYLFVALIVIEIQHKVNIKTLNIQH